MPTTLPVADRLLTVDEYAALDRDDDDLRRFELLEGVLVMTSYPTPRHMAASGELYTQLRAQLPFELIAIYEVGVNLQFAAPDQPGTARAPDLIIATRKEFDRVNQEGGLLRASGVVLAVEIISPGSRRADTIMKRRDYADAGIPHYWIVDLDPRPSLTACELSGGEYRDADPVTGTFATETPLLLELDIDALV